MVAGAAPAAGKTVDFHIDCKKSDGKQATMVGTVSG